MARYVVGDVLRLVPLDWHRVHTDEFTAAIELVPAEAYRLLRERWKACRRLSSVARMTPTS